MVSAAAPTAERRQAVPARTGATPAARVAAPPPLASSRAGGRPGDTGAQHRRSRHRAVREARPDGVLGVGLSPTYAGCPATEDIRVARERGTRGRRCRRLRDNRGARPAWSSDWITPGRPPQARRLRHRPAASGRLIHAGCLRGNRPVACPRCVSTDTECISEFGSTPCKALHRCRACLEPFECFKCI